MALCNFSSNFQIFDITPVENLFIHEFMLKAPGDFVKVYIYGLKQCYHSHSAENTIEAFSHALGLEIKMIENAFHYWERQGILSFYKHNDGSLCIDYYNIKDVLYNKNLNSEKSMYKFKDFNQNLQQIFDTRLLTPQEYLRIYDWIEVLNLPMEVVLMMIQFYIIKMGSKLTVNYLDKVAEGWAKDGINTLQKAEEYIEQHDKCYKDTMAVLKYLGIHRSPSKAELELYRKWSTEWGFDLNAILFTCKETTKIQSPNMGYLDKILSNLNSLGKKSTDEIRNYLSARENINDKLKEVYYHLGSKSLTPVPEHQAMYSQWTIDYNMDHSVILFACKQCVRKKTATFDQLDRMLNSWIQNGLYSLEDIKNYLHKKRLQDNDIKEILERAGESRELTMGDRKLYKKWSEELHMHHELILLAAEYAIMAEKKLPFINKVLQSWHSKNITTIKDARADHESHGKLVALPNNDSSKGIKKQLDFNKFAQHAYTEEELEYLFENIETK